MSDIKDQIIEKQEELIKFYEKEFDRTAVYLHVHNMGCGEKIYNRGNELRKELASLKSQALQERGEKHNDNGKIYYECPRCGYRMTSWEYHHVNYDYGCPKCQTSFHKFIKSKQSDPTPDLC